MSRLIPAMLEATIEIIGDQPVNMGIDLSLPPSERPAGCARLLDVELRLSEEARAILDAAIREAIKRELQIRWSEGERERQPGLNLDRFEKDGVVEMDGFWEFPKEYRQPRSAGRHVAVSVAS